MAFKKTSGSGIGLAAAPNTTENANAIDRHTNDLRQRIARRAFELCAQRGWIHGQDLDDWLRAESELTATAPVEVLENDNEYTVRAEVPGFTEKDLDIFCESDRLLIRGNAQTQQQSDQDARLLYSDRQINQVFRLVNFPQEINPDECEAVVQNGILELTLPKSEASKPTRVQVKAA